MCFVSVILLSSVKPCIRIQSVECVVWCDKIVFNKETKVGLLCEIMSFSIIVWKHVERLHLEYVEFRSQAAIINYKLTIHLKIAFKKQQH